MLNLNDIESYYPDHLKTFKRFILREYLQYKILEIVFNSPFADKLCFLGGTCLRIVHNQTRFSEDLDFDNFDLSEEEFQQVAKLVETRLNREGYEVEIKSVIKGAFHCYIRFPRLLYDEGLTGHREEKILIQLDTEPQNFDFKPEPYILNKFEVFTSIFTTRLDILLAQKFYAIINRKRSMGRDFFDVVFILGKGVKPNYKYLDLKLSITNKDQLKDVILDACDKISMDEMARDVMPFLFNKEDAGKVKLFVSYIKQVEL